MGTFVPYTHYSVKFPNAETKPRVSGNFVIEVFQNDDPDDLIIRRRFIVYENLVVPSVSVSRAVDLENFSTQQQVSASVNLIDYPIQDYFMDLDLSILQNRRWNNSKNNLKPTFINDGILTYNFMGSESFDGGTEFHTFDTKRLNQVGLGVKLQDLTRAGRSTSMKRRIGPYPYTVFKTILTGDDFIIVQMLETQILQATIVGLSFILKAQN